MVERTPEHIAIPSTADGAPRRVVQITCGSAHNVVRCDDGAAVSWGVGGRGQLARGKPAALRPDPTMYIGTRYTMYVYRPIYI